MESEVFNILNAQGIMELEQRISSIEDEEEKKARQVILDKIFEEVSNYEVHVYEYSYKKKLEELENRGIKFVATKRRILDDEWDNLFDALVPVRAKLTSEDYNAQYKWHIFSFRLLEPIKKEAAREALSQADKGNVKIFYQHSKEAYNIENADLLTDADIDELCEFSSMDRADMYIYNPDKKWTYIKTHEEECGPYFYQA